MLFVTLGVIFQQSFAQSDSVVLPEYMLYIKYPKQHVDYKLKKKIDYIYDEQLGGKVWVTYFTIGNKKPVRVNSNVSYNNTCKWWYFKQNIGYSIENNIVASYCINEDECIIFVKTMEFYKFKYSDSSITYISDLSETGIFDENIKSTYSKTIDEVNDIIKKNPNDGSGGDRCLDVYCKFMGIRNIEIGRMLSGNLVKIGDTWFLSFEYKNLVKQCNEKILFRSTDDLKTWTRCKVYLNYKYKTYNESLKSFTPFLLTFENNDTPLSNIYKNNNDLYFSDNNHCIYKSTDDGNTFRFYKLIRPFPEPVVPTFENTNH